MNDLRYAFRSFRREPAFAAGVVFTLALAVGINAAMFGLVERLMLAPPPGVEAAERVMRVTLDYTGPRGETFPSSTFSYPGFRAIAGMAGAVSQAAAVRADSVTVGRGAELTEVPSVQASGAYFALLRVHPLLGRVFGPADDAIPSGNPVVVLGNEYWRQHFGGRASAIGARIVIEDEPFTIIGVAPAGFNGSELAPVGLFLPLTAASRGQPAGWWNDPRIHSYSVIARLRDGISPAAAGAMITSAMGDDPSTPGELRLSGTTLESLVPGRSARTTPQSRIALWLSLVSVAVLLIATANVAILLLLRSARRRRDTAVRVTLGAGPARLARTALVESLLLALAGGGLGVLLSRWFGEIVRVTLLPGLAATAGMVDGKVVLGSIVAACIAGILAGLVPLLQQRRRQLASELRTGGGHGGSRRLVVQNLLVTVQVALCTLLLVGAGLFVRSLDRVQSQDLGFSTARLLYVTLDFRGAALPPAERDRLHEDAARRVSALPGVTGATVVEGMPFGPHHIPPISIPGVDLMADGPVQLPILYGATPAYLEMMGVTLREGRLFTERDGHGAPLVALVNETMARTVWPGQRAIGQCIHAGFGPGFSIDADPDPSTITAGTPCREVVGIVRDSRARSLRLEGNEARLMQYYVPFPQIPAPPFPNFAFASGLLVRTAGDDPGRLALPVQRLIQSGSAVSLYARVRPYQDLIDPQLRSWRLGATLFSAFGILALGIAAVGLFAVVSYLVTQRTQEIGVRLALGGTRRAVGGAVVRDALRMAGGGAVVGLVIALIGAPVLQSLLFQTSAREPAVLIGTIAMLLAVSLGAAALPAWRASRVSPMGALRGDT
jgi:predicted permease